MEMFRENLGKHTLEKKIHANYLMDSLKFIGVNMMGYDVTHSWLVFYITNGLYLLNQNDFQLTEEMTDKCIDFLEYCKTDGAFGGGDGQVAQLAPTYAAFLSILNLGEKAYYLIDKEEMYQFFKRRRCGNTFTMMEYGECDLRAIYIVTIIVKVLKMNNDGLEGVEKAII